MSDASRAAESCDARPVIEEFFAALKAGDVSRLDELFAHWDSSRLDALVRVLGAVEGRQVVVSTCHAALADRLERSCGARVVELAGPGGALVPRPLRRLAVATAAPQQEGPTLLDLLEG